MHWISHSVSSLFSLHISFLRPIYAVRYASNFLLLTAHWCVSTTYSLSTLLMIDTQAAFLSLLTPIMCGIHENAPNRPLVTGSVADQRPQLLCSEIHLCFTQGHTSQGQSQPVTKCSRGTKTSPLLGNMGFLSQLTWLEDFLVDLKTLSV